MNEQLKKVDEAIDNVIDEGLHEYSCVSRLIKEVSELIGRVKSSEEKGNHEQN